MCAAPDGTEPLRRFAAAADADPAHTRWSYRRDLGRTRIVTVDTRAARILDEGERAMLEPGEARWVREQVLDAPGSYDHLLVATSLPWLLPPLIHDAETWSAALCRGERGPRWAGFGEYVRQRADLEHWAAFPSSFAWLKELFAEVGRGPGAPATVCVLSGDVHHAYVAEPVGSEAGGGTRTFQLTCSPLHNAIPVMLRLAFRFGWSERGRRLGRVLARHGRAGRRALEWHRAGGPWFGNQLMTLTLRGRSARLRLDRTRTVRGGGARLERTDERTLAGE